MRIFITITLCFALVCCRSSRVQKSTRQEVKDSTTIKSNDSASIKKKVTITLVTEDKDLKKRNRNYFNDTAIEKNKNEPVTIESNGTVHIHKIPSSIKIRETDKGKRNEAATTSETDSSIQSRRESTTTHAATKEQVVKKKKFYGPAAIIFSIFLLAFILLFIRKLIKDGYK
jgi:hypothetical protein